MSEKTYYYIQKNGVYSQGVYMIGEDLDELKELADAYATKDIDDYHDWDVYKHTPGPVIEIVYTGKRHGD